MSRMKTYIGHTLGTIAETIDLLDELSENLESEENFGSNYLELKLSENLEELLKFVENLDAIKKHLYEDPQ